MPDASVTVAACALVEVVSNATAPSVVCEKIVPAPLGYTQALPDLGAAETALDTPNNEAQNVAAAVGVIEAPVAVEEATEPLVTIAPLPELATDHVPPLPFWSS